MKYLKDTRWKSLPIPETDYRPRFFVELYQELLDVNSLSTYQARTMNIFTYAQELLELINHYKKTGKNKKYITTSLIELMSYLNKDSIARLVFKNQVEIIELKFKNIKQKNNELKFNEIKELELILRLFIDDSKKNEYWNKLTSELICLICDRSIKLEQRRRNLDNIEIHTKLFITYLLNNGFTNQYLFNRKDYFTNLNNYRGNNFEEQLNKIIGSLNFSEKKFRVNFLISSKQKIDNLLEYLEYGDFIINNQWPNNKEIKKFIFQISDLSINHYIISLETKSSNYANAVIESKNKLLRTVDLIITLVNVKVYDIALIDFFNSQDMIVSRKCVDTNKNLFDKRYFNDSELNLLRVQLNLNNDNNNILINSLRYFRLANHSNSTEQKFLNTWIALETLFVSHDYNWDDIDNNGQSIISKIIEYIPVFYNSFSVVRKVRYIKETLINNNIKLPFSIQEKLNLKYDIFSKENKDLIKDDHIYSIFKDEELFTSLMRDSDSIYNLEHLKYRCTSLFELIKTKDSIKKSFNNSNKSIYNQLYRLYSIRNRIAHQGYHFRINPQLINHLTDYLIISYAVLSINTSNLSESRLINSILDIFSLHKLKFDIIEKNLEENNIENLSLVSIFD